MKSCPFHDYYLEQAGSGFSKIYRGTQFQKGHGIGSFLRGLFRSIFPLIKTGAQTIGREALVGTAHLLNDFVEKKPAKESLKQRLMEVGGNLKEKAMNKIDKMVGSGCIKRKRKKKTFQTSKKRKTVKVKEKTRDIFSKN